MVWIALATLYVVWGSTYLGIAIAIETIPPFVMLSARFAIAGVLLLGWSRLTAGPEFSAPSRRELRDSSVVGLLLLGIGNGFVAFGEQTVPSGIAALCVALMPLFLVLLGRVVFGERIPRLVGLGIVVGFAGVILLVAPTGPATEHLDPLGIGVLVLAPLGWSIGTLFSARRAQLPRRPMTATAVQMLAGSVGLLVEGAITGEFGGVDPGAISSASAAAFVYLVFVGSIVGFSAYVWLLRNGPLPIVATYAYVNPVVAVALGAVVLGEPLSPRTVAAAGVIIAGVALVITARSRIQAAVAAPAEEALPEVAAETAGEAGPHVLTRDHPAPAAERS
jgi:drug/metabolite transporter (DMT)-like permease